MPTLLQKINACKIILTNMEEKHWYALRSKPNKELFLYGQLLSHHIETYLPLIRARVVNPRARRLKPYFPGYLFVHLDAATTKMSELFWMPGSAGLVAYGSEFPQVPPQLISAIQKQIATLEHDSANPAPRFHHGDRVRVQGGPFHGYEAIFDACLSGHDRVRVLLKYLQGRQLPVELSASQLQAKTHFA